MAQCERWEDGDTQSKSHLLRTARELGRGLSPDLLTPDPRVLTINQYAIQHSTSTFCAPVVQILF